MCHIEIATIGVISKVYTQKYTYFIKYPKHTLQIQQKKLLFTTTLHFLKLVNKKATKKKFITKHRMLRATNLHQPRTFYTSDVGDVGDI